jgi:hypothetical protein
MQGHVRPRENPMLDKVFSINCGCPLPPSTGRLVRVAAGLAQWTPEELAWIKGNPAWFLYEQRLRNTFVGEPEAELVGAAFSSNDASLGNSLESYE